MTPEEAKKIIEDAHKTIEELRSIERNFQLHHFRIDSSEELHFCLVTDSITGLTFYKNGDVSLGARTSREILGRKITESEKDAVPAKLIQAINGDIRLKAQNGKIILDAHEIIINGVSAYGGQVTINSSNMVQISTPVFNAQSDYTNLVGAAAIGIAGGEATSHGEYSQENTKGTDEVDASFFGKILTAIKKFKKFFESNCG